LAHEIEFYDSGDLVAWVNVTSLSSSVDTVLYLYYGNVSCGSQENVAGVWDSGYRMVQHLHQGSALSLDDSTGFGNDVSGVGGSPLCGVSGWIYQGVDFDGSDDFVSVSDSVSLSLVSSGGDDVVACSMWVREDGAHNPTLHGDQVGIVGKLDEFFFGLQGVDTELTVGTFGGNIDGEDCFALPTGEWHYLYYEWDEGSSTASVFVDGLLCCSGDPGDTSDGSSNPLLIGQLGVDDGFFNGVVDEVRFTVPRSGGWVNTSFLNQFDVDGFFDVGVEEVFSGDDVVAPEISGVLVGFSDPLDTVIGFGWENITCTVTDDIEVQEVKVNVTFPDSHVESFVMVDGGSGEYYYNVTFGDVGSYSYHIWAVDSSGNMNTSSVDSFVVTPNWDINMDHVCNIIDFSKVSAKYDMVGVAGWVREDVNNDGVVNIVDFSKLSVHYDETW